MIQKEGTNLMKETLEQNLMLERRLCKVARKYHIKVNTSDLVRSDALEVVFKFCTAL